MYVISKSNLIKIYAILKYLHIACGGNGKNSYYIFTREEDIGKVLVEFTKEAADMMFCNTPMLKEFEMVLTKWGITYSYI